MALRTSMSLSNVTTPRIRHQRKPTWEEKKNPEGRCAMFTPMRRSLRATSVASTSSGSGTSPRRFLKLQDRTCWRLRSLEDLRSALEQIESVLGIFNTFAQSVVRSP